MTSLPTAHDAADRIRTGAESTESIAGACLRRIAAELTVPLPRAA